MIFSHYDKDDIKLDGMLEHIELLDNLSPQEIDFYPEATAYEVHFPTSEYRFLHEAAIIEFKGILFAAWYNCHLDELWGVTPIRLRKSFDGGKTWTEAETVVTDTSGTIKYCPPVFGIDDGKLYMFLNEMYIKPDRLHALDLYIYNEETEKFEFLWSKPLPFKLNTNVYKLDNGKLLLPGRIAEMDGFPKTPAVLISDSGKIDADWRLVYMQNDQFLPDGAEFVHPELSAIVDGEKIYIFCRNDLRQVPIMFVSNDYGETWSKPIAHDIPFSSSKIYSDTLKNGRNYVIGNLAPFSRTRLAIFFSKPGKMKFDKGYILQKDKSFVLNYGTYWHYPVAYEYDNKLFVIYSADSPAGRGAVVSALDLSLID